MNAPGVLILTESVPRLQYVEALPAGACRCFGADFREVVLGTPGQVGFVDWMRGSTGQILGVRLWLHREWFQLMAHLPASNRIRIGGEGIVELAFREGEADPELSCDQAFDETRAYLGDSGALLLAVAVAPLSTLEIEDVRRLSNAE